MAMTLHPMDAQTLTKHQDNMMASLARRLEAARAAHNTELLELLEQEQRQLAALADAANHSQSVKRVMDWCKSVADSLINAFSQKSELEVQQITDPTGVSWWYAWDPRTGNCLYADTENEVRMWIEQNYSLG